MLAAIQQEGCVAPREARRQELQDSIPAMGVDKERLLDRDPNLSHGVVLQEPHDPDKLPNPVPRFFFLPLETAPEDVEALRQVQTDQGPGVIQRPRLSFQQRQVMTGVEKNPFLAPGSRVLTDLLVPVT